MVACWGKLGFWYPEFQGKKYSKLAKEGCVTNIVGFGVLKEVTMKISIFCDVTPHSSERARHFGGINRF
jgi:hypothetical protein